MAWLEASVPNEGLSHATHVALTVLITLIVISIPYVYALYVTWEAEFGGSRLHRSNADSPSFGNPPVPVPYEVEYDMVQRMADAYDHTDIKEYKNTTDHKSFEAHSERMELKSHAERTKSFSARASTVGYGSINYGGTFGTAMKNLRTSLLPTGQHHSDALHMDHQYIPFLSYVWCVIFIGHNAMYLWVTGTLKLKTRATLQKWGWLKPKPFDPSDLAAKLILEMSLAVHYVGKRKEGDREIGGFFFPEFPWVKGDGTFALADLLSVELDLTNKRLLWAKLDDIELTPDEAVTFLWFYIISANHVKLHALSNWAINLEASQVKKNPFPAQNSLVTTIYNYFGYTAFTTFFEGWKKLGIMSDDWDGQALLDTFNTGIDNNFFAHPLVPEIAQYSDYVDFFVKLRPIFLKEFGKVKRKYFPGCHGEALFVGTCMHSLDHTHMDWSLEDPLWLDVSHPEYGKMAEMGRIVKVGFVSDLPGLLFHKRYKGSKHPFYEKIYEEAAKINLKLADHMDTCIVK